MSPLRGTSKGQRPCGLHFLSKMYHFASLVVRLKRIENLSVCRRFRRPRVNFRITFGRIPLSRCRIRPRHEHTESNRDFFVVYVVSLDFPRIVRIVYERYSLVVPGCSRRHVVVGRFSCRTIERHIFVAHNFGFPFVERPRFNYPCYLILLSVEFYVKVLRFARRYVDFALSVQFRI